MKSRGQSQLPRRNIIQKILAAALILSALLETWILIDDRWLWAIASSHAYGLVVFAAIDLTLALGVLGAPKLALPSVLLVSIAQIGAMTLDALTYAPIGVQQSAFRSYLLSDVAFVSLIGIEFLMIGMSIFAIATTVNVKRHIHVRHATPLRF